MLCLCVYLKKTIVKTDTEKEVEDKNKWSERGSDTRSFMNKVWRSWIIYGETLQVNKGKE